MQIRCILSMSQMISRISKGRNDAIFLANSVAIDVPRPNLYFLLNRSRQETFKWVLIVSFLYTQINLQKGVKGSFFSTVTVTVGMSSNWHSRSQAIRTFYMACLICDEDLLDLRWRIRFLSLTIFDLEQQQLPDRHFPATTELDEK